MTDSKSNLSTRGLAVLMAGDIAALLLFTLIGQRQHAISISALQVLVTTAPFIIGWFVVGYAMGAFKPKAYSRVGQAAKTVLWSWLVATPVSLGLRALFEQKGVPLSFAIVTFITVFIFLLAWRISFTLIRKKLS
jgi:FlaA1/EpsC-like NDP-sugar epimerase